MPISKFFLIAAGVIMIPAAVLFLVIVERRSQRVPVYGYVIAEEIPHREDAFTEGLVSTVHDIYESSGLYGASTLSVLSPDSGAVISRVSMQKQYFAEGITLFKNKLFQATYREGKILIYDRSNFRQTGELPFSGEAWGLTSNSSELIISNGTNMLMLVDPDTGKVIHKLSVTDKGHPVAGLNELEWINGRVLANIWMTEKIVCINPDNGDVTGWINLEGLSDHIDIATGPGRELNGIAYDAARHQLIVTGKMWPKMFRISLVAPAMMQSKAPTETDTGGCGL